MRSRRVLRLRRNLPPRDLPQIKDIPRKLKVSGLPSPRCLRLFAAWRPNSIRRVFFGCSDSENSCSRSGIGFLFKTDHDIVRIPHDDHVARGLAPSPAFRPEIETVVQVSRPEAAI